MFEHPAPHQLRFLALTIAIWLIVCCGGTSVAATRFPMPVQPNVVPFVYGCAADGSFCNVYTGNGTLRHTVTAGLLGPLGIAVDSGGRWYVANSNMSNILVFAGGRITVVSTISDTGEFPGDVAVGRQEVAVSNIVGAGSAPGSVSVYRHGATSPSEVLHYPSAAQGVSVSFDFYGNCYWSFTTGKTGGDIVEFPKCSANKAPVALNLAIASPGGIAFDRGHNLWYVDRAAGLFRCRFVKSCTLVAGGFIDPYLIKFNEHDTDLYLTDTGYGIYQITGVNRAGPLHVRPMYTVTPFAAISPSAFPAGVAAGSTP